MSTRLEQKGFSLVELMVALVLGLVVSFAAVNIYGTATTSVRGQDAERKVIDRGAFALAVLSRHIRNAGFVDWTGSPTLQNLLFTAIPTDTYQLTISGAQDLMNIAIASKVFDADTTKSYSGIQTIHGCTQGYTTLNNLTSTACGDIWQPTHVTSASGHAITVATQVRAASDALPSSALPRTFRQIPTSTDNTNVIAGDCNGRDPNGIAANPKGMVAVNRFYLDIDNSAIRCVGNGDPSTLANNPVIASNIGQLVFRYGQAQVNTPSGVASGSYSGDLLVSTTWPANTTTNLTSNTKPIPVTVWPLVTVVEICVLAMGDVGSRPTTPGSATNYVDCNGDNVAYPEGDSLLRVAMSTTVNLRNRYRAAR